MSKKNKLTKLEKELLKIRWKDIYIDGIDIGYQISDDGSVKETKSGNLQKTYVNKSSGYTVVIIVTENKTYFKSVHRLVAIAYVDNPDIESKVIVNHKDGNKLNNHWWNLEWMTNQENMDHAVATGLINNLGSNNPNSAYTEDQIKQVCKLLEDGIGIIEIHEMTGVSRDSIGKVKSREVWKHISKDYNIPFPAERVYTTRPENIREEIIKLLNSGMTDYGEILLKLGLPDIRRNRKYVTNINIALKSKV